MISYKSKTHLITRAEDCVLQRLASPDAPGNEGLKWLVGYAAEMRDALRAQTENLNAPVLDAELRQVRGALHVLGIVADSARAAEAMLAMNAARAAKNEEIKP
jgi:hypothetical protein